MKFRQQSVFRLVTAVFFFSLFLLQLEFSLLFRSAVLGALGLPNFLGSLVGQPRGGLGFCADTLIQHFLMGFPLPAFWVNVFPGLFFNVEGLAEL